MQFNVASLLKETTAANRTHLIDDDMILDGQPHHLTGSVRFDRTPGGILVRARVRGELSADCSRCLKPASSPVEVEFEEEYIPTVDVDTGKQVTPPEGEDDAFRIDRRHMIDLREPIEQYWTMSVPMAPVCRPDCAGLCPVCGDEIASEAHACTREQVDARWARLGDLELN